jgi:hypothetical protein
MSAHAYTDGHHRHSMASTIELAVDTDLSPTGHSSCQHSCCWHSCRWARGRPCIDGIVAGTAPYYSRHSSITRPKLMSARIHHVSKKMYCADRRHSSTAQLPPRDKNLLLADFFVHLCRRHGTNPAFWHNQGSVSAALPSAQLLPFVFFFREYANAYHNVIEGRTNIYKHTPSANTWGMNSTRHTPTLSRHQKLLLLMLLSKDYSHPLSGSTG